MNNAKNEGEKIAENPKKCSKILEFIKKYSKRWFIDAFSGMAQGLFVTLIAGTILALLASWIGDNYVGNTLKYISNIAKSLMGAGIGVGIAHALSKHKLLIFSTGVAGMVGAFADKLIVGVPSPFSSLVTDNVNKLLTMPTSSPFASLANGAPGNPIGAYVVSLLVIELVMLYAGKTKLDIILVPLGALAISLAGVFVAYPFIWLVNQLGLLIALATDATPFVMGIVISVVMGVLLTMPTSSAAIWLAVATPVLTTALPGSVEYNAMLLAGGAATVGCASHMIGFAVASFRENGVGGLVAQGLGTSMLQIPNIMRKPIIMLPMIISSAILGPISTCVFKLCCTAAGGGMGTSGLVGVFGIIDVTTMDFVGILGVVLLMFVLPAIINLVISEFMRKKGWINLGDMKLDV